MFVFNVVEERKRLQRPHIRQVREMSGVVWRVINSISVRGLPCIIRFAWEQGRGAERKVQKGMEKGTKLSARGEGGATMKSHFNLVYFSNQCVSD